MPDTDRILNLSGTDTTPHSVPPTLATWGPKICSLHTHIEATLGAPPGRPGYTSPVVVPLSVPIYSVSAGADTLGHCLSERLPGAYVAGGSEPDENASEAFRRRYRFSPFKNEDSLPPHMLQGVYIVCSGLPRLRRPDALYKQQLQRYTNAQVPILVLEHVPECLKKADKSTTTYNIHAVAVCQLEAAGYHIPLGDDGHPGQLLNATDFGGALYRSRRFTIAVRQELWDEFGSQFQWPEWSTRPARNVRSLLDPQADPRYLCCEDNALLFEPVSPSSIQGVPHQLWRRRGSPPFADGVWDLSLIHI